MGEFPSSNRVEQARRGRLSGLYRRDRATNRSRKVQFYHRQGWSVERIGKRLGISRRTVYRDLKADVSWLPPFALHPPEMFPQTEKQHKIASTLPRTIVNSRKSVGGVNTEMVNP